MLRLAPKCHAILKRSTLGLRDFEKMTGHPRVIKLRIRAYPEN